MAGKSTLLRAVLIAIAVLFLAVFLFLPLVIVFVEGLRHGPATFVETFADPAAWAAVKLTLLVAAIAVPFNAAVGIAASWAIAKFEFRGKNILLTLIDLPFSVSPVISGLVYVLLFGAHGWLGPWLRAHDIEIIFAVPGIVLATVLDNIAFGLRARPRNSRPPEAEIRSRARALLDLVQLDGVEERFPSQLSGGQRQRVALARALAIEPRVLLLDEPFGALDTMVRKDLRRWLRELHDRTHHTTLFVTHDQEEAFELADRVVVLNQGKVEQIGTPDDIVGHPASPFVASFVYGIDLARIRPARHGSAVVPLRPARRLGRI